MKKPEIAGLSQTERQLLIDQIKSSNLDVPSKGQVLSTIDFAMELQQKLKDSKISISTLKRLFGTNGEALKKLLQTF
jgi:hypothetical protein